MNLIEANGLDYGVTEYRGTLKDFSSDKTFLITDEQGQDHSIKLWSTPVPAVSIGQTIQAIQLTNYENNATKFVCVNNLTIDEFVLNDRAIKSLTFTKQDKIRIGVICAIAFLVPFGFILIPIFLLEHFDKIKLPDLISISQSSKVDSIKTELQTLLNQTSNH